MKVEKRTFIVSGGSSGLGLATVQRLVADKAYVAVLDVSPPPLEQERTRYFKTDITQTEEVARAVDECVVWTQETGAVLGGVVNAAAIGALANIVNSRKEPHSLELYKRMLEVNLVGTFDLTRQVCRHLMHVPPEGPDGERGVVVMVSSSTAFEGQPGMVAYAASKGGVLAMTMPLALDLARFGIRVNTIVPGTFKTNMTTQAFSEEIRRALRRHMVFPPRFGRPEEFAEAVGWIIESGYMNGETVRITGAARIPGKL